jgi:hypothetical protein
MECQTCHKEIGKMELPPPYRQAFQVRAGYVDESGDFEPKEDVGYYCSECLKDGV